MTDSPSAAEPDDADAPQGAPVAAGAAGAAAGDALADAAVVADTPVDRGKVIRLAVTYTLLRLVLFIALAAAVLLIGRAFGLAVPYLIAMLISLVVSLPLTNYVFRGMRDALTLEIARWDHQRRVERASLEDRLER